MLKKLTAYWQRELTKDFGVATLKMMIIVWSIFIILLALWVDNPWILAGIFLYEVLP